MTPALNFELGTIARLMHIQGIDYEAAVREFKKLYIREVLIANGCNQQKAAAEMAVHRNTLSRTMDDLGMSLKEIRRSVRVKKQPRAYRRMPVAAPLDLVRKQAAA
jgi:Fis family transcriptional regulator, factor for inversion stimulation protein